MTMMTPYAASKIVNAELKDRDLDKALPPQMIYTYVAKGYIKSVEVDGKKRVTEAALREWMESYITKLTKVTVTASETEETVEADFDGTVGEWTEA